MTPKTAIRIGAVALGDIFLIWLLSRLIRTNVGAIEVIVVSLSVLIWWLVDANRQVEATLHDDRETPTEVK